MSAVPAVPGASGVPAVPGVPGASGVPGVPMLEVRGLEKSFGANRAVASVSFSVAPGESVALIGPNGAGKTTVFDCICGQVPPDAGTVTLSGRDLGHTTAWRRARLGIGRTFQRLELFEDMTVRDHLVVALRAQGRGVHLGWDLLGRSRVRPDEIDRVDAVLSAMGLSHVAGSAVAALDLGTCRLVELARAVVVRPRILLADEPSSGLDAHEAHQVATTLRTLTQEHGMALLLVEHDLALVAATVGRVLVMDLGALVASGTYDEVMAEPVVRRAYLGARR